MKPIINFDAIPHMDERRAVLAAFGPYVAVKARERAETALIDAEYRDAIVAASVELNRAREAHGKLTKERFAKIQAIEEAAEADIKDMENLPSLDAFDTDEAEFMAHDDGTPVLCALTGLPILQSDEEFATGNDERVIMRALVPVDADGFIDAAVRVEAAAA